MQKPESEDLFELWEEFLEERYEELTTSSVKDMYEDVLRQNLKKTALVEEIPEEPRKALIQMGSKVYAEQTRRILDSSRLGPNEIKLAAATAFLDGSHQIKIGAQAQGIVDIYWDDIQDEVRYDKEDYQEWAVELLANPWPPHHLEESWESVDRFRPPDNDPAYY